MMIKMVKKLKYLLNNQNNKNQNIKLNLMIYKIK